MRRTARRHFGSAETGAARPPLVVVVVVLAILVYATTRYINAHITGKDFEARVRGAVLLNPMMKDDELTGRIQAAAGQSGVRLEPSGLVIERGNQTQMTGSAVALVRVRYVVPWRIGPLRFERRVSGEVKP